MQENRGSTPKMGFSDGYVTHLSCDSSTKSAYTIYKDSSGETNLEQSRI